ncbi:alanine racemase [Blastococcus atacamensis]|uniref:alanine racemase n=1 Tax=Blastococcus atacamensis TaxID=2070508 RepID=UPI000CEC5C7E|nr:alanine racemase [Blastococcus atacamensis]
MFLDLLRRRNPDFLRAAARLHRAGELPANCYAIDLDAVRRNARAVVAEASRLGLAAFPMTKQIGRNPDVARALTEEGLTHAVGVDLQDAEADAAGGLRIGHLGHLVQVPRFEAARGAALEPSFWTVFNETKAAEAAGAAATRGREQALLARIVADGDRFYRGHEGGFDATDVVAVADRLDALTGGRFAGVTTFPAMLFDQETRTVRPTPNLATLQAAVRRLRQAGRSDIAVNGPGTTSTATLPLLAEAGVTQVEPGHGLTGTTPWHAVEDLVEEPAVAYVSEVSHSYAGQAYVFGGGLYVDPVLGGTSTRAVVVGDGADPATAPTRPVDMPAAEAIDYYAMVEASEGPPVEIGDTVVFGFRAQVFVTRALTAAIAGVSTGSPHVVGVWAADGSTPLHLARSAADSRRIS